MGTEIDNIIEFEELATRGEHAPTALSALNLDQMQFLD
jgi:tartronate-semialdehyde synthase